MMEAMTLLYLTIFLAVKAGQRIAMTNIKTTTFLIIALLVWIYLKSIM